MGIRSWYSCRLIMTTETLVERLRKRAEIRRKATCRGPEDRMATLLDEAADEILSLEFKIEGLDQDIDGLESDVSRLEYELEEAKDHL